MCFQFGLGVHHIGLFSVPAPLPASMADSGVFVRHGLRRTSAAFIKELMRRSVVYQLERTGETMIELQDVECTLEELLVSGGSLNLMLLGACRDGQGSPTVVRVAGK